MSHNDRHPPRFITLEGGEGSGKTTLIDFIASTLLSWGIPLVRTREPGGVPLGEQIRAWLLARKPDVLIGNKAELLLFLAARSQHIEQLIAPAIQEGKVVICDRFNDSTVAYQGGARRLGMAWVQNLCNTICGDIIPDLTIYLDVDPQEGLARTRRVTKEYAYAGTYDYIESEELEFHKRVREAFLEIAASNPKRFYVLDANRPVLSVQKEALKLIAHHFNQE